MDLLNLLRKGLDGAEPDLLRDTVQVMAEGLMGAEANHLCSAEYRERSDDRVNRRNGYRQGRWDRRGALRTKVGIRRIG